jgi:NADH dehydrogenase
MTDGASAMGATAITGRHRVVIVGCGFGGLFAAKALRRAAVDVTVIDRTNHHLFQPLLYQLATGLLSEGDIAPPIRDVLRHQRNTSVVLGEVVAVDLDTRHLNPSRTFERTNVETFNVVTASAASSDQPPTNTASRRSSARSFSGSSS